MEQLLFKNVRAIVTCDPTDQVFYDSDLLVEGPATVSYTHLTLPTIA